MKNIELLNNKKNTYFLSIGGIGEIGGNNYLYSISTLNTDIEDQILLNEFIKITGLNNNDIELIKSYTLNKALPSKKTTLKEDKNIYFSGDWSAEPSIDGAIKSGRICAEKLNDQ